MLRLDDDDEVRRILTDVIEQTGRFVTLAPGMLPFVSGLSANTVLVVQTVHGEQSSIADDVRRVFPEGVTFVDSGDPAAIRITRLTFGLPAFVLHALDEGRRIAQESDDGSFRDLWPMDAGVG